MTHGKALEGQFYSHGKALTTNLRSEYAVYGAVGTQASLLGLISFLCFPASLHLNRSEGPCDAEDHLLVCCLYYVNKLCRRHAKIEHAHRLYEIIVHG